jgi:hypothetical protein
MTAIRIRVTYVGGEEKIVRITPLAQFKAEERFHGLSDETAVRSSYFLAWASLSQAGQESATFEQWLEKIEDAEGIDDDADKKALDPTTGEALSPNGSSPSVSEPASQSAI